MGEFREGNSRVLISTDVWARGLDVQQVRDGLFETEGRFEREGRIEREGREGAVPCVSRGRCLLARGVLPQHVESIFGPAPDCVVGAVL